MRQRIVSARIVDENNLVVPANPIHSQFDLMIERANVALFVVHGSHDRIADRPRSGVHHYIDLSRR